MMQHFWFSSNILGEKENPGRVKVEDVKGSLGKVRSPKNETE